MLFTYLDKLLSLTRRPINKSEVSRKTGISKVRLSELALNENTHLRAKELYLIALAIHVDPAEMFMEIHEGISLEKNYRRKERDALLFILELLINLQNQLVL